MANITQQQQIPEIASMWQAWYEPRGKQWRMQEGEPDAAL